MRLWRAVVLMNLALGLGLFLGYLAWGRDVVRLERELEAARQPAARPGSWEVRAIVRAVLPQSNIVVLTHEEIPGVMASMTMGFPLSDGTLARGLDIGEPIRVQLSGVPPNLSIT